MVLTLSSPWLYENMFLKSHKLKEFCFVNVIITRALTKEESEKEERLLKRRFELISDGIKNKDTRINVFRLFVKGEGNVVF